MSKEKCYKGRPSSVPNADNLYFHKGTLGHTFHGRKRHKKPRGMALQNEN
jgi:hypothetical protein